MDYTLATLNTAALEIGKATILYAPEWNGTTDLTLTHLGDTEGAVAFTSNESIGGLRLPEHYGEGLISAFATGADPVLTAPLFLATPALRTLIAPTADNVIGAGGRRPVVRYTVVVMPQALYYNAVTGRYDAKVRYTTASGWQKSAVASGDADVFAALATDETRLLGLSIWMWSGYWERPPVTFEATVEDVVKNIEEATFRALRPTAAVLLGRMVTLGSPAAHSIIIDVP
jgi:hypothetical protein